MDIPKRYFTVEEAQQLLPHIRPRIKCLVELNNAIEFYEEIEVIYEDEYEEMSMGVLRSRAFHALCAEYYKEQEALMRMGVIVKDPSIGLVDFYSLHNSREVFLCWKLGEEKVRHWHEKDDGYKGRKPCL